MRAAAALIFVCAGCSSITSAPQYDSPKLAPLTFQVSTDPPPDGDGKITRDAILHVTFDDYPDPDTVVFGPLLLRSGTATFDVIMRVSLVDKSVIVQPRSLLQPNTSYELVVDGHFRALSGRTPSATSVATLSVGDSLNPSPSPSPSPTPYTWYDDIKPMFVSADNCDKPCHNPDLCSGTGQRHPSSNFDVTAPPDDPVLGLINVASELMKGEARPLLRVKPGDSANSELLRKLLGGDPHAGRSSGEPVPANLAVPGRRMPLYEQACANQILPMDPALYYLNDDELRRVQDWIDQGAPIGVPPQN
jgi:hypothetical protein